MFIVEFLFKQLFTLSYWGILETPVQAGMFAF